MVTRAFALDSQRMRYDSYAGGLEFYDFLIRTQKQLQDDPGTVTAKLKSIQEELNNRTNAVAMFAGNESSISLNRELVDAFLASLDARETERAEYDLPVPDQDEALIFDSGVQYNMMNLSYKAMGLDDYEGWMTVAGHIVTDFFMTPLLRDRYGVYDPYCANKNESDGGIYVFSYQDPNIAETFELFDRLSEMLREEEIDQETIDDSILSAYSLFAAPKGTLSGAIEAAEATLQGKPQDQTLTWLRQIKGCTPEKLEKWAEMLKQLTEEGAVRTAGGATAIHAEAARYDKILDPFGTADR